MSMLFITYLNDWFFSLGLYSDFKAYKSDISSEQFQIMARNSVNIMLRQQIYKIQDYRWPTVYQKLFYVM